MFSSKRKWNLSRVRIFSPGFLSVTVFRTNINLYLFIFKKPFSYRTTSNKNRNFNNLIEIAKKNWLSFVIPKWNVYSDVMPILAYLYQSLYPDWFDLRQLIRTPCLRYFSVIWRPLGSHPSPYNFQLSKGSRVCLMAFNTCSRGTTANADR